MCFLKGSKSAPRIYLAPYRGYVAAEKALVSRHHWILTWRVQHHAHVERNGDQQSRKQQGKHA